MSYAIQAARTITEAISSTKWVDQLSELCSSVARDPQVAGVTVYPVVVADTSPTRSVMKMIIFDQNGNRSPNSDDTNVIQLHHFRNFALLTFFEFLSPASLVPSSHTGISIVVDAGSAATEKPPP